MQPAVSATPISWGLMAPAADALPQPRSWPNAVLAAWPSDAAAGRSWCAPAASRCCSWMSALLDALHRAGFEIAVETNGTQPVPAGIDWVCVSPKADATLVVHGGDELKLVFPQDRR